MERIDVMWEPVRTFLVQIGEFFPRVLLAILILVVGWLIAKAVRFAVIKALRAINFNVLTERAGIDGFLRQGGGETDTTGVLGLLVYWLTILTALMIAANSVGLIAVTELIVRAVHRHVGDGILQESGHARCRAARTPRDVCDRRFRGDGRDRSPGPGRHH